MPRLCISWEFTSQYIISWVMAALASWMDGGIVPVDFQYMVSRKSETKRGDTFMPCDMGKISKISKQTHHVILVLSVHKVKSKPCSLVFHLTHSKHSFTSVRHEAEV